MDPSTLRPAPNVGQIEVDTTKVKEKTYYSNLDGMKYYFKNGAIATFMDAQYTTDEKGKQEELDEVVKLHRGHNISDQVLVVKHSDAKLMREVGGSSSASGTGTVGTAHLAGLVRQSGK